MYKKCVVFSYCINKISQAECQVDLDLWFYSQNQKASSSYGKLWEVWHDWPNNVVCTMPISFTAEYPRWPLTLQSKIDGLSPLMINNLSANINMTVSKKSADANNMTCDFRWLHTIGSLHVAVVVQQNTAVTHVMPNYAQIANTPTYKSTGTIT